MLDVNSGAVFTNKMAEDPRYADNNFVEPPLMKEADRDRAANRRRALVHRQLGSRRA